ncbi:MAG: hypothetical protein RLZZ537_1830 [Pseudomonadota bacterium]
MVLADQLLQHADDTVAFDEAGMPECEISQPEHFPARQRAGPLPVLRQASGAEDATDQCAHRTADDGFDAIAAGLQFLDDADMRQTARTPGTKDQGDAFAVVLMHMGIKRRN